MSRKTWKTGASMFWTVTTIVVLCAIAAVCVWRYYEMPARAVIERYDLGFAAIVRGMTSEDVTTAMGQPHAVRQGESVILTSMAWNNNGYGQGNPCDFEYVYRAKTVLLRVDWIIGFDKDGKVIAKYRDD